MIIENNQVKKNNILIQSKKTKIKTDRINTKFNSKKNKNVKINKPILKRKNTKKLNEIEIIVLFSHLIY